MMQCNFPKRKFALLLVIAASILFVQNFLMLKPAYAAEKYTRKSISLINEVLLFSNGKRIPKDKIPDLTIMTCPSPGTSSSGVNYSVLRKFKR